MEIKSLLEQLQIELNKKSQAMEMANQNFKEACNVRRSNISDLSVEMKEMNEAFVEMCNLAAELKPVAEFIVENLAFARKLLRKSKATHESDNQTLNIDGMDGGNSDVRDVPVQGKSR